MNITFLKGYPDYIGKRFAWAGFGSGPVSYVQTGDLIQFPRYDNYVDAIPDCTSQSGNYRLGFVPSAVGPRATWVAQWFYSGAQGVLTVVQNAAGVGMTPGTYIVNGVGGSGSGAQISVTVLTATTIATPIVLKAGSGYGGSVPTFTPATGGTPVTFTVTAAPAGGPVPATTNLSAEFAQLSGLGGTY